MAADMPLEQGPYLIAACLCERVLDEKDGVKSVIRFVDRITRTMVGPSPAEEMEPFEYPLTLLVKLKSGWARGAYPLQIRLVKPSGESPTPFQRTIYLEGEEDRGTDVVVNMRMKFDTPGVHWFDVHLGEVRMTRIPLRIVYIPQVRQVRRSGEGRPPDQPPPAGV